MNFAPAKGGDVSILWRRASAGGQLEQPSEVNSSTRMGCASALDISAVEGLFSTCRAHPSAVDAVCRNERPKNKTAHADDRAEPHRDMAMILHEKILSGNSPSPGSMSPRLKPPCSSLLASRITTAAEFSSLGRAPVTGAPRGSTIFPDTTPPFVLAGRLEGRSNAPTKNAVRNTRSLAKF